MARGKERCGTDWDYPTIENTVRVLFEDFTEEKCSSYLFNYDDLNMDGTIRGGSGILSKMLPV